MNKLLVFLLGFFLLNGAAAASGRQRAAAHKTHEKRARQISLKIKKLISDKKKTNYSLAKRPSRPKPAPLDKIPPTFLQPSRVAQYRIVRVHNWLAKGERILKATPAIYPVRGRISSRFGPRIHPKTQEKKNHLGIDIVARLGAPVAATADGRVVFSGSRKGYGKVIVLDHGFGFQTIYAHNSLLSVRSGFQVKRGQIIARVGATGHTTGPHLHYEVRKNGEPLDPRPFLQPRRLNL